MSSELSRETRKLEIRLENYMKAEQEFVEHVKECVRIFRELMDGLEEKGKASNADEIERMSRIRNDAIKALSQVLKSEGNVEHEKSHIFESYGALVLCLEKTHEKLE